jgi:serine phosphatase RsbU (regulator of sigma subunit)
LNLTKFIYLNYIYNLSNFPATFNGNFAFCCADSTGHGVPGAIMSIANIACLKEAVTKGFQQPDEILNETRKLVIEYLKNDGSPEGGKDGMDCSLLVLNHNKTELSFASANNPVFIVRSVTSSGSPEAAVSRSETHELLEFRPDKMPVGKHDKDQEPFTLQTISLQKGDVIYTLTDGFPDQFGGEKGKKYMIKNLKNLLLSISHLPMNEQEERLFEEFTRWKGENEQIDDVCIIGLRV